jgi:serine acetyltransferase
MGRLGFDGSAIRGPDIEDEAVIGAGAVLLPGIVVGRGATIGAGAIVTHDVPSGVLVVGIPARERQQPDPSSVAGAVQAAKGR